jgi:hypothetical protein
MTRRIPAGEPGLSRGGRGRDDNKSLRDVPDTFEHPQQAPLFDTGRARNHVRRDGTLVQDPSTSFDAIPSPAAVTRGQRVVLNAITLAGRNGQPLTLEGIVEVVRKSFPQLNMSASGVRSRVAELTRKGSLVVVDERGITAHGRRCRRFRRAD